MFRVSPFMKFTPIMAFLLGLSVCCSVFAQDEKKEDGDKPEKKKQTVEAKVKPIKVYESITGVIQSTETGEVKADIKSWSDLEIKKIADEGMMVRAGQEILWFETEKLDLAIKEAEFAFESAKLDHNEAEIAAAQAQVEFNLNNDLNNREMEQAQEDYEYYQNVTRKQRLDDIEYDLKSSSYYLEYAQEELDQLLKMYNEDELTEESEQIVLKRAQRGVESSERGMKRTQIRTKRSKEVELPRDDIRRQDKLKRATLVFEKKKQTLPYELERSKITLEKSKFSLTKTEKKLNELKEARGQMVLKAPMSGMLYYGRCVRGKWSGVSGSGATTLEPGKKIPARKVIFTVINPEKLVVRSSIDEDKIRFLKNGVAGTAVMKFDKDVQMPVAVKAIKNVPMSGGKFDCMFDINNLNNSNATVLPAMSCKVSIKVHENNNAIVVPKASVFSDDEINHYVYTDDEQPQRKAVKVGMTSGDDIEILEGLTDGDKILKAKP